MGLDQHTRRSYDAGGFATIFNRTARMLPVFAICAVGSCLLWRYAFHIPLDQLKPVAVVPCIVGLLMLRVLALVIPASAKDNGSHPRLFFRLIVVSAVFAAFIATDFLISTFIYYYALGLKSVAHDARVIVIFSSTAAGILIVIAIFSGFPELWVTVLKSALQMLRAQTQLTTAFFVETATKLVPPSRRNAA
jgi:hypothetical protein